MNKENLLYIYNLDQAIWMIEQLQGKNIKKIWKGSKGDIFVSFKVNNDVLNAMKKWKVENPNLKD